MKGWLRLRDFPEYCGICERTGRDWLKKGLRASKVGGVLLIKREWLDEFIETHLADMTGKDIDKIVDDLIRDL